MVSMMAIFVALVLNRISTPFQRIFYEQSTVKEQQKEELSRALQVLGMMVVAIYGVTGDFTILGMTGVTIVQIICGIALGLAVAQLLEVVSVSHLRPILEGQTVPTNVYDRWIWDTIFIVGVLSTYTRFTVHFGYLIFAWLLYTVIPYAVTRYNMSRGISYSIGMKAYKWGTIIWIFAAVIHLFVL